MKTKIITLLSVMSFTSLIFANPGDVITEDSTTDPGLPRVEIDGDLVIEDADGNNTATPGLFVEGLSVLEGGLLLESTDVMPLYASGGASGSNNPGRKVILSTQDHSLVDTGQDETGLSVLTIDRSTGAKLSHTGYNIWYGNSAAFQQMADDLAALEDGSVIVVITSDDAWLIGDGAPHEDLLNQLYRMGASSQISFHHYPVEFSYRGRKNYVLVGMPGIGAGNGIEVFSEAAQDDPSDPATTKTAEVGTLLVKTGSNGQYVPLGLENSEVLSDNGDGVFQRIGVGTDTPSVELDVVGNATISGDLNISGKINGGLTASWGTSNTASGSLATVWGLDNASSGYNSTVWGRENTGSGNYSTVWGSLNTASAYHSTAWGRYSTASNSHSTAWGYRNAAHGYASTAWGRDSTATGKYSTVWGSNNTATAEYSTGWGRNSKATGKYSTAWGVDNTASSFYSTVWGRNNTASDYYSTAWGESNVASRDYSTAWGYENAASGSESTAWGYRNTASGSRSTVWGRQNKAESIYSTVFGTYNIGGFSFSDDGVKNDGDTKWIEIDPLFEIGIGTGDTARANALTMLKDGRVALGQHTTLDALQTQPETVQVQGALKVGDYITDPGTDASEGAIRFGDDGSGNNDLLAYVGGAWKSLTRSSFSGIETLYDTLNFKDAAGDETIALNAETGEITAKLIRIVSPAGDIPSITY